MLRALDQYIVGGVCPVREGVHAQQGASVGVGGQQAEAEGDHLQPEASTQHVVDLHTARLQNELLQCPLVLEKVPSEGS